MEMNTYIGTKILVATPMTREEYNAYRGWEVPGDEDGKDEGYFVEYRDGGAPNHPEHAGYISWSPKDVFENTYVSFAEHQTRCEAEIEDIRSSVQAELSENQAAPLPWQERVRIERDELSTRLAALTAFINQSKNRIRTAQMQLLNSQRKAMKAYLDSLDKRISDF